MHFDLFNLVLCFVTYFSIDFTVILKPNKNLFQKIIFFSFKWKENMEITDVELMPESYKWL